MKKPALRARRGSALILVLLMTLAVAALAVAAIFMSSSASLLSRFYDRERQFAYAAESGIQRVISTLAADTGFTVTELVPTAPVLDLVELEDAAGAPIPGARVRVWAARTFDTTSSGPVTISLLAQVVDGSGTRLVRRADLRQDAFSAYTLATNTSTNFSIFGFNIASNVPFASGAFIPGKIHINGSWGAVGGSPSYRDSVFATGSIIDNANRFRTGKFEGVSRLAWPSVDSVQAAARGAAVSGGRLIEINAARPTRLEFFVRDDDEDGTIGPAEGYVRAFELHNGDVQALRAAQDTEQDDDSDYYSWNSNLIQNQCGAFYLRNGVWRFFPVATHRAQWAWAIIDSTGSAVPGRPYNNNNWSNPANSTQDILRQPTARCFPAGSPYLLNTSSFTNPGGQQNGNRTWPWGMKTGASTQSGGSGDIVNNSVRTCTLNMTVGNGHECQASSTLLGEWRTLGGSTEMPLDRGDGAVVFVDRSVYVHGTVAGHVTLFVQGSATIIDRIVHAGGANAGGSDCAHLFGLIAREDVIVDDNSLTSQRRLSSANGNANWILPGGEDGFTLHGSYFALTGAFRALGSGRRIGTNENAQLQCAGSRYAGGCLSLSGSVAAHETRVMSSGAGRGFRLTPAVDACLERGYRPPQYPLANRYRLLRAVNVRPAQIIGDNGIASYFAQLQGRSDIP